MTNGEIYKMFLDRYGDFRPNDYRPLSELHYPKSEGIIIWGESGDVIVYFPNVDRGEHGE